MACPGPEVLDGGEQITTSLEQVKPLLSTKLIVPPTRPKRVDRSRLTEWIDSGLDKALILISAPAGFGKTTLASSWLSELPIPSTWLSLDEEDNDPIRFLQYFLSALQNILPALKPDLLGVLKSTQLASYQVLLNIVINEITRRAVSFVLVLDDFHTIHAQPVLEMITYLLDHVPPQIHLVIISRTDPPLPLSRYRARDQLVEIRAEQLRFTQAEIAVFLNEVMGLKLSASDLKAMEARTEGWIAGLQLAALSLRGCKDIHSFVAAFVGSHSYIMDYLTEEVLNLQTERVRSFLLQTSILTRMCASLCEAVVEPGRAGPLDGQAMLESLELMNLFVIPLDDKRQWYRYHHLFTDVLTLRLEHSFPEKLSELHRRASHWYEENGIIPEAIQHALKAGDQLRAVQLVEQHGCTLLMSGEGFTLLKWVEAVESYSQTHPWLAALKAWAVALTGRLDEVEPALQTAEGLFSPIPATFEVKILLGSIASVRAYHANLHGETQRAADYARRALETLPEGNDFSCSLRSVAISILGDASWMNGNLESARRAYLESIRISQAARNHYMTMIANSNLADVLMEQGELHHAARIFSETLQIATRTDGQKLPLADSLYAGLSEITYEWNQLEAAAQNIDRCIELCQQWGNFNLLAKAYLILARLEQARGNQEKGHEAMWAAEQLVHELRLSHRLAEWVKISAARWWIGQGSLERALEFVQQSGAADGSIPNLAEIPYFRVPGYLLLARLSLAQGDHDNALSITGRLLEMAEAGKRVGSAIKILVLQALILQGKKDTARAMEILERALYLAQPEGYTRVFLDEGEPMVKLLFQAKSQRMGRGYASELLSALGGASGTGPAPAQLLIEPLTSRELEVLKLIEDGCTNQDIASRLVISIPTVKRHISNIYSKLGAKSRTQAVSLGKELGLFG